MTRVVLAAAIAVCLNACGAVGLGPTPTPLPPLTESQVTWCSHHDMTPLVAIGAMRDFEGNELLDAAHNLGIPIPQVIQDADAYFAISNVSAGMGKAMAEKSSNGFLERWPDALVQWRTTPDYARACVAVFELR